MLKMRGLQISKALFVYLTRIVRLLYLEAEKLGTFLWFFRHDYD